MSQIIKIGIAADHAGYSLKQKLIEQLKKQNFNILDFGTNSEESCNYPDYVHPLAVAVIEKKCDMGIVMCASGNGVNMTANKHQQIRSALCWDEKLAKLAREHNNANVCALPAHFISFEEAVNIVNTFINSKYEGGRHDKRIAGIPLLQNKEI